MQRLVRWVNRPVVAIIAVGLIAAGVRFWNLSSPKGLVFDEIYYAKSGCILLGWSNKTCMVNSSAEQYWRQDKWDVGSWVHPPLGKWQIALGEKAFGMTPFGWRFSSAVAGTAVVIGLALIAQLLWGSALWTFVSGLLLATESLNVVESRAALLDVHLELWVVVGFLFLLLDRRWIDKRTPPDEPESEPAPAVVATARGGLPGPPSDATAAPGTRTGRHVPAWARVPSPIWRPWRFAAGVGFALAASVKWDGAFALFGAFVLSIMWETTRRKRGSTTTWQAFGAALAREALGLTMAFVFVPMAVYLIVYLPWFNHFGWSPSAWWANQKAMWSYHEHLQGTALDPKTHTYTPTHPYYSPAWKWLLMLRPVSYWVHNVKDGLGQIIAIGNPAIFWGSIFGIACSAWQWRRARDWRAGFIVVAIAAQYIPWFLVSRPEFFFYVLPMTPFLVLACVYTVRFLSDATILQRDPGTGELIASTHHPYRPVAWAFVIVSVGLFVWFYPVLTGHILSSSGWRSRVWFGIWI